MWIEPAVVLLTVNLISFNPGLRLCQLVQWYFNLQDRDSGQVTSFFKRSSLSKLRMKNIL